MHTLSELLEKLRLGEETVEIEAKSVKSINDDVLQTVSSLSNEPGLGGGYILFGVSQDRTGLFGVNYDAVGVDEPGKLQENLATRCRNDLVPDVRPAIRVEEHEGKPVIIAFIPEASPANKPVYLRSEGLPKGAYRRIGSTDQHCTEDDIAILYQTRAAATYDSTPIHGSTLDDIDPAAIAEFRRQRSKVKPDAAELSFDDNELLYSLGATTEIHARASLTIGGLILFGRESSLRRFLPMVRVDYIRVEGREWVPDPDKRYAAVESRGPLLTVIPRIVAQVLADIPSAFVLAEGEVHRRDVPLVPRTVIREAIVNALMHRTYRVASPVQIIRYSNRIEMRNPGASLVTEEKLGEPGSVTRNEKIAAVLHEVGLAETKGTGIRAMQNAMHQANLTPPLFESDRDKDEFGVMLLVHHLLSQEDQDWLANFKDLALSNEEARALVVIREAGAITNAMYRDINRGVDTLAASATLRRLRDAGLLIQKGKGRATFYIPTGSLLNPASREPSLVWTDPNLLDKGLSDDSNLPDNALSGGFQSRNESGQPESSRLPRDISQEIQSIGKRAAPEAVRRIIIRVCQHRPTSAAELAQILRRDKSYLATNYLTPMVRGGQLELLFPDEPAHPKQAYKAPVPGETGRE